MSKPHSNSLRFEQLSGGYGDTQIISNLSSELHGGQALGIFGRNGVGKTTLSKMLIGHLPLLSGSIELNNQPIDSHSVSQRRHLGISYMPQEKMVFDELTVAENLSLFNELEIDHRYFELFPKIKQRLNQKAGTMSGGERKILAFVRTLMEQAKIIILDEPSEGVQAENIDKMVECLQHKKKQGVAILLIEQNLTMLMAIADNFLGMDAGKSVFAQSANQTTRAQLLEVLSI